MFKRITILMAVTIVAAVAVSSASAHYGNQWFYSTGEVTQAIEAKYRMDVFRKCMPAYSIAHSTSNAYGGATRWDHFDCLIDSYVGRERTCWVTAHVTGATAWSIVLTSNVGTRDFGGCGSADIRKW